MVRLERFPTAAAASCGGAAGHLADKLGIFMKQQKCPVVAMSNEVSKIWRMLEKLEHFEAKDGGRTRLLLQERQGFFERQIQAKQATHPTGALYQLGQIKQLHEDDAETLRYVGMIARYLISQGGKICQYSDPRNDEDDFIRFALRMAADESLKTAA
jgi:hypothetical protein